MSRLDVESELFFRVFSELIVSSAILATGYGAYGPTP